jgi:hypothetical protein
MLRPVAFNRAATSESFSSLRNEDEIVTALGEPIGVNGADADGSACDKSCAFGSEC